MENVCDNNTKEQLKLEMMEFLSRLRIAEHPEIRKEAQRLLDGFTSTNSLFKDTSVIEKIQLDKEYSNFAIVRSINDLNVQTRNSKLSLMVEYAEDKIKSGEERELIIIQEIDNSAAKKLDWKEPAWKRIIVCNLK